MSKDVFTVDEQLPQQTLQVLQTVCHIIAVIIAICIVAPYVLVLFVPLIYIYKVVADRYRATSREMKRIDSITRSPIFNNFEETLHGISVFSAFQLLNERVKRNEYLIDRNYVWQHATGGLARWLEIRVELIAATIVLFSTMFVAYLSSSRSISSGVAGFLLVYSLQVSQSLQAFLWTVTELELSMNSVERISWYTDNIEQERPHTDKDMSVITPGNWPSEGNVELRGLVVRYRPGMDPVLKGVSTSSLCIYHFHFSVIYHFVTINFYTTDRNENSRWK